MENLCRLGGQAIGSTYPRCSLGCCSEYVPRSECLRHDLPLKTVSDTFVVILPIERAAYYLCWGWTRDEIRPQWCAPATNLNIAGWALTMGTNAVATAMIAWKAW